MSRHDPGVPWIDPAVAGLESTLAARAFAQLPERWQTVLWHTEVEGEGLAEVAVLLGLTPNGVSALAYRAREGLRQAYLREHLAEGLGGRHGWTVERLGAWARGGLSKRSRLKVDQHLLGCERCRVMAAELVEVNSGLCGVIAPAVLGGPAAAAYLAAAGARGATEAGVAAAGATATAGAAAGGAGAAGAGSGAGVVSAAGVAVETAGTGGGSALGSLVSWVAGTAAGKAAAVAVVVGGTALSIGAVGPPAVRQAAPPSVEATGAAASPGPVTPLPAAPTPTAPAGSAAGPGSAGLPPSIPDADAGSAAAPGDATGSGTPDPADSSGASGDETGSGSDPAESSDPPAPSAPEPVLEVGSPAPVRVLQAGRPGEIGVPVANVGTGDAADLTATVTLPAGYTIRAGGSGSLADWHCTGGGQVATCTISILPATTSGTIRIKIAVADGAGAGTVSGLITSAGGLLAAIPTTTVEAQAAKGRPERRGGTA